MYLHLFNATEDTINVLEHVNEDLTLITRGLISAQRECEEMYIADDGEDYVDFDDDDEDFDLKVIEGSKNQRLASVLLQEVDRYLGIKPDKGAGKKPERE